MGNNVEVVIKGKDETAAAVRSARQNLQALREEKTRLTNQTKLATGALNQFGNIASAVGGGQVGYLVNQVEGLVRAHRQLESAGQKSGAALMLGLGAVGIAAAGAYEVAMNYYVKIEEEAAKKMAAATVLVNTARARQDLQDPSGKGLRDINESANAAIQQIRGGGASPEDQAAAIDQIEKLRNERTVKFEEERHQNSSRLLQNAIDQRYAMESEHLGAIQAEKTRYENEQADLKKNSSIDDVSRQGIEQEQYRVHQLKLSQIHQANQDKILMQEKQTRQRQLGQLAFYTEAAGSLMGSLSTLAGALGKKQFGLSQALRYGEAIMNTAAGVARAFADYAWPYSMVVAATVGAAGAAQVATIAAQKPPQAHSGLDYVPEDATYKLKKGEMVLDPGTSDEVRENATGGGGWAKLILNERVLGEVLWDMSRNGRLRIDRRSIQMA